MFDYAIILGKINQNQKSLDLFNQILRKNKYHLESYLSIAVIWQKLGNMKECLKSLQQAEEMCEKMKRYNLQSNKID